jgi:hypothetical protein
MHGKSAGGGTILGQMSVWEWDGAEAKPFLVKVFQCAADFGGFRFDSKTVRISTKEALETVCPCGRCPEPRGVWSVRITAGGFLKPEIQ